jgi:heat shock protein HtpX
MISALQQLQLFYGKIPEVKKGGAAAVATLKISGKQGGFLSLMATHPPLDERIARLKEG